MNLYNVLNYELESIGSNWSTLEKCLYLYLRTCEIFNYDERWYLKNSNIDKDELFNKKLDIFKIDDYRVICSSWSNMYKDLVELLLIGDNNLDMISILGSDNHAYIEISTYDSKRLILDPTMYGYSFLEASKNLPVSGISYINYQESDWYNELELEKMLKKVNVTNYPTYQEYLKLVKDELIGNNKLNNITTNTLEELFNYFIETSNYQDLGVVEANNLVWLSLSYVLGEKLREYGFLKNKTSLFLRRDNKETTYILRRINTNSTIIAKRKKYN